MTKRHPWLSWYFFAALLTLTAPLCVLAQSDSARPVIQQMSSPLEEQRQKTLKYSYSSTMVGYVTYRHVGDEGFFHVTTLAENVIPILPDEKVVGGFRDFLSLAEEQNVGVALTGTFLVWSDDSVEFSIGQETRYEAAPASYAVLRAQFDEQKKKRAEESRQNINRRNADAEQAKARKKQEADLKKDIEEFEKAIQKSQAQKDPRQARPVPPPGQPPQQAPK